MQHMCNVEEGGILLSGPMDVYPHWQANQGASNFIDWRLGDHRITSGWQAWAAFAFILLSKLFLELLSSAILFVRIFSLGLCGACFILLRSIFNNRNRVQLLFQNTASAAFRDESHGRCRIQSSLEVEVRHHEPRLGKHCFQFVHHHRSHNLWQPSKSQHAPLPALRCHY